MARDDGWSGLFATAFKQSRNAMVLVDEQRRFVDVNGAFVKLLGYGRDALVGRRVYEVVVEGPLASPEEWARVLPTGRFSGEADLVPAEGGTVSVQWAASVETVTGRRLVLFVALSTSRWGHAFRRPIAREPVQRALTRREREVVALVALGQTGPEIAEELHIVHDTVRTHVRNAMEKLGARSRAHLVAKALGDGHVLV